MTLIVVENTIFDNSLRFLFGNEVMLYFPDTKEFYRMSYSNLESWKYLTEDYLNKELKELKVLKEDVLSSYLINLFPELFI